MEKAILIGVQTYTSHSFEERMEEMKELALACDIEICMSISQNLEHPHKKYYMNPGKIEEVKRIPVFRGLHHECLEAILRKS